MRAAGTSMSDELLVGAKRACFGDRDIATLTGIPVEEVLARRDALGLHPGFAMVDTSAAEFAAETPYFYSTYAAAGSPPEAPPVVRPASVVIGSGPVRIGQGIEFDYCAVQAADALRRLGRSAIMVNSNPETVSTDFDASSRLYFESLDAESVIEVLRAEGGRRRGRQTRSSSSAARRRSAWRHRLPRPASRCAGSTSTRSTRPRSGCASPGSSIGWGSRSPRAAWRHRRRGVRRRRASGLPGHRPAVVRHRRPCRRLRLRAGGPGTDHRPRRRRRRRASGAHRRIPGGPRARRRRDHRRHRRADPGADRARRDGRCALGRLDRRVPAAAHLAPRTSSWSSTRSRASPWRSACAA